jgi:uncharacterized C2H2 Zn-finger protein
MVVKKVNIIYNDLGFVVGFQCPYCNQPLSLDESHTDDIGTTFFICPKCGETSSLDKPEERKRLEESLKGQRFIDKVMSQLEGKNGNSYTIKPLFNVVWKRIHPAIDVVNGTAYVGVDLPCEITKDEKTVLKEFHFLVGSDRTLILCRKEELNNRRIQLSHAVVRLPNCWSFQGVEMWLKGETSVNPKELYITVKKAFETYIEFEDARVYDFLTLWAIGTYFYHLFNSYPYLYIGGTKQSGKTKLLTLLSLICHNAIFSNNISTASAFRLVQSGRCTLLMDETEKLNNPDREIDFRNMLYAGYKKGALVYRTHKDTLKPEPFEVYSPKAIANIRGIEDVLEDRCITLILKRGKNLDIVNREIPLELEVWQQIRDMLYAFYLSCFYEFTELTEHNELSHLLVRDVSEKNEQANISKNNLTSKCENAVSSVNSIGEKDKNVLKQRELELWKPILTLALYFNRYFNGLFHEIFEFAKQKATEKEVENRTETLDLILVKTLVSIVKKDDFYKVSEIKNAMGEYFDEPQKWLTTKWIGNALRRLGFTEKRRMKSYEYFLSAEKIKDLAERLGVFPEISLTSKCENTVSSISEKDENVLKQKELELTEHTERSHLLVGNVSEENEQTNVSKISLTSKCESPVSSVSEKEEEREEEKRSLKWASCDASDASDASIAHPGKVYEGSLDNKEEKKIFIQNIEPASPASPASPRKVWLCGECAKEYNLIVSLAKFGKCEVCGKTDYLGEANISIKPNKPNGSETDASKLLQCPGCNACFFSESDLKAHLRGVHNVED